MAIRSEQPGAPLTAIRLCLVAMTGLVVANCANQGGGARGPYSGQESREFGAFSHSKYGRASERVVADGQDVPKGGGRDLVGKTYRIAGRTYTPYEKKPGHTEVGHSSWYGAAFHGRKTANGEIYDRFALSAAHRTMPLPSYARVTNLANSRSIIVRVNDRGPYHGNRIIDVSQKTADVLDFRSAGTGRVKVEYIGRASVAGSDDRKLLASLRTDGSPAPTPDGVSAPRTEVMVASAQPVRQSLPVQAASYAPASQPTVAQIVPAAAPATTAIAMAQPAAREPAPQRFASAALPAAAPLPPERPFDLMTIPNAGTPVMNAVPGSASGRAGTTVAQLFYAEPDRAAARFEKSDPWSTLKPQRFKPLKIAP
ncbi:MAG: septal ring lytic transglycosylase RlpA family protein [Beijerinckiaceae bacterium]